MWVKNYGSMLLLVALLVSCSGVPTLLPTLQPTFPSTLQSTATFSPTETLVPTITLTPIPSIQVGGLSLPDPRFTNPDLFNLGEATAPIPRFVTAMEAAGIELLPEHVASSLQYKQSVDIQGNPFCVAFFHLEVDPERNWETMHGDFPLLIATNEDGQWTWSALTLNLASSLRGIRFGALLHLNETEQKIVADQLGSGVTYIGWEYTHPSENKHDWQELGFHIQFSKKHKINVVAAPLIWGQNVPNWAKEAGSTPEDLRKIMLAHIETAVSRHRVRVGYWEVVNEANHLGRDIFWINLGPSYVNEAFAKARKIDPDAKLFYNDYINLYGGGGIEQDNRIVVIEEVVASLLKDGTIDAIGIQIDGNIDTINLLKLREGLDRLKSFGLPIIISEYSLRIDGPGTPEALTKQSKMAVEVMRILQDCECVIEIDQWGLSDDLTNDIYGKSTNAGLYYYDNDLLLPKPVVYAIMASFALPSSE